MKDWSRARDEKDGICDILLLAVTSLWPPKVGSRGEIYSARWKLMLISDRAKDLVKNCFEGMGLHVSFSTTGFHWESWRKRLCESRKVSIWRFMWGKHEFYGVIWRCFARIKCWNIMSGFRKCCDCHKSRLLCDLPKVLTDNLRYVVKLVLPENFVPSIQTLHECLMSVKFCRRNPILCSKIVDFKFSLAMSLMIWLTKKLYFYDVSNVVYYIAKSCYSCERNLPSVANKVVIVEP